MKLYNESNFSDFMRSKKDPAYLSSTKDLIDRIQKYLQEYDSNYTEQELRKALERLRHNYNIYKNDF